MLFQESTVLELIRVQAIERIRDYLVSQIRAMRSPNINSQIIQQQRLVKFKDLFSYLSRAHPALAGEISQAYINTMRWYYTSNFTRYLQALEKIKIYPSDRNEVLGGDPSAHRTGLSPSQNTFVETLMIDRQHSARWPSWLCGTRPFLSRSTDRHPAGRKPTGVDLLLGRGRQLVSWNRDPISKLQCCLG